MAINTCANTGCRTAAFTPMHNIKNFVYEKWCIKDLFEKTDNWSVNLKRGEKLYLQHYITLSVCGGRF
jgi:hypothetical protein